MTHDPLINAAIRLRQAPRNTKHDGLKKNPMINEVADNFYRITLRLPYRLRHVNAYLLAYGKDLTLFDTGLNSPGAFATLEEDLKTIGFTPDRIAHVYLTHIHADHASLAGMLQKRSGAQVHLSPAAFEEYEHYRKADPAVNQLRKFYARQGMPDRHLNLVIDEFESIRSIISDFQAADFLQNHESRTFGDRPFQVLFTPGHSFGHVCFFFPREGFLLAGDHVLPYIAPILSPNIFDEHFRPLKAYLESFALLETLPVSTVLPGHGSYFTDLKERLADIRAHHEKKKAFVAAALSDRPQTAYDILNKMIAPAASDFDKFLALNEVIIYLQELAEAGAVQQNYNFGVLSYCNDKG
jgi:glyoxylase-like metal-dependent hydrolase (beta-lactamase superfamily II)